MASAEVCGIRLSVYRILYGYIFLNLLSNRRRWKGILLHAKPVWCRCMCRSDRVAGKKRQHWVETPKPSRKRYILQCNGSGTENWVENIHKWADSLLKTNEKKMLILFYKVRICTFHTLSEASLSAEFNGNDDISIPLKQLLFLSWISPEIGQKEMFSISNQTHTWIRRITYFPFLCRNVMRFLFYMNYWRFDRFHSSTATLSVYVRNIRLPRNMNDNSINIDSLRRVHKNGYCTKLLLLMLSK